MISANISHNKALHYENPQHFVDDRLKTEFQNKQGIFAAHLEYLRKKQTLLKKQISIPVYTSNV